MKRSGAQLLGSALLEAGVGHAYGVPGSELIDAWHALAQAPGMRIVRCTSELDAAFMANGSARATGGVGVVLTIAGPGLAYTVPGLAEARLDSVALVHVVTAPAPGRADGSPGLQAIPQEAMLRPLVKDVIDVAEAADVPRAVRTAVETATGGEPGPVVLQLSRDALRGQASGPIEPWERVVPAPDPDQVDAVAERLVAARRPLIVCGQGAAHASRQVRELAGHLGAPVTSTTSGRGVVSESSPLSVAVDIPGGDAAALNELVASCDLVLALGCRFSHNGSRGYRLRLSREHLVRVDTSQDVLRHGYEASISVVADAGLFVDAVAERLRGVECASTWDAPEIARRRSHLEREVPAHLAPELGHAPASELFAALGRHLPADGILATDSGLHQYVVRAHHVVREPRTLLVPTDFQSMGFGIPAAIGAAVATGSPAVAVIGDGGLAMVGLELLTAVRERIELTVLVFADGYLGLIRRSQLSRTGQEVDVAIEAPELGSFARSVGASYLRIDSETSADDVLGATIGSGGVSVVEVPMGDPPGLGRLRARGRAQAAARRLVGEGAVEGLKGVVRRRH